MTRDHILEEVRKDHRIAGFFGRAWGESLWGVLANMGVNVRPLVATESDPWYLTTWDQVEGWLESRCVIGSDGHVLRICIDP